MTPCRFLALLALSTGALADAGESLDYRYCAAKPRSGQSLLSAFEKTASDDAETGHGKTQGAWLNR